MFCGGAIEIGAIHQPMLDELYYARKGQGAYLNGLALHPSNATELSASAIEIGWNARGGADSYLALVKRLVDTGASVARGGSGALGLAWVAAGRSDGYVESSIHAWDCLAALLLVREAGGYASDFLANDGLAKGWAGAGVGARHSSGADPSRGDRRDRGVSGNIVLTSGAASAEISMLGAEARAWRVGGHELLWPSDAAIWGQISPILFPVVGWTRDGVRVDGRHYPLRLHGFAASQSFSVAGQSADFVRLSAGDNASTRALYPFGFRLFVEYRLSDDALGMAIEVENSGEAKMPYACGLHPGFRWPFAGATREGAKVVFDREENPQVPAFAPGGLVAKTTKRAPLAGRALPLDDALFANDAVCFLGLNSRSLRFVEANGAAIAMAFLGFPHVALWTRPGAPFLCLEAWTGYSDPEGFDGELIDKPSMRVLEPGAKARHEATYRFHAPSRWPGGLLSP